MPEIEYKIEIPFSKRKVSLLFFGAILFIALGIWFLISPPASNNFFISEEFLIRILGAGTVVFFCACAAVMLQKLLSKDAALILTQDGITDNSSGISAGFIPWSEIVGFMITKHFNNKYLVIMPADPERFLKNIDNRWKKK